MTNKIIHKDAILLELESAVKAVSTPFFKTSDGRLDLRLRRLAYEARKQQSPEVLQKLQDELACEALKLEMDLLDAEFVALGHQQSIERLALAILAVNDHIQHFPTFDVMRKYAQQHLLRAAAILTEREQSLTGFVESQYDRLINKVVSDTYGSLGKRLREYEPRRATGYPAATESGVIRESRTSTWLRTLMRTSWEFQAEEIRNRGVALPAFMRLGDALLELSDVLDRLEMSNSRLSSAFEDAECQDLPVLFALADSLPVTSVSSVVAQQKARAQQHAEEELVHYWAKERTRQLVTPVAELLVAVLKELPTHSFAVSYSHPGRERFGKHFHMRVARMNCLVADELLARADRSLKQAGRLTGRSFPKYFPSPFLSQLADDVQIALKEAVEVAARLVAKK